MRKEFLKKLEEKKIRSDKVFIQEIYTNKNSTKSRYFEKRYTKLINL